MGGLVMNDYHHIAVVVAGIDEEYQNSVIDGIIDCAKKDIVKEGLRIGVPYELTWSCYEGGSLPCGQCATCMDRAAAFAANGVKDPALPEDR